MQDMATSTHKVNTKTEKMSIEEKKKKEEKRRIKNKKRQADVRRLFFASFACFPLMSSVVVVGVHNVRVPHQSDAARDTVLLEMKI